MHALLRTLEIEGLVSQGRDSSKYQLGPNLVHLGNADALANRTKEVVWVGSSRVITC